MLAKLQPFLHKDYMGMPVYCWLVLFGIGLLNDVVQRHPGLRAMSLFQLLPNLLKLTPLGRMPLIGAALERLDTPEPPKVEPPAP